MCWEDVRRSVQQRLPAPGRNWWWDRRPTHPGSFICLLPLCHHFSRHLTPLPSQGGGNSPTTAASVPCTEHVYVSHNVATGIFEYVFTSRVTDSSAIVFYFIFVVRVESLGHSSLGPPTRECARDGCETSVHGCQMGKKFALFQ